MVIFQVARLLRRLHYTSTLVFNESIIRLTKGNTMKNFNYRQAAFTAAVTAATFVPAPSIAHADDYGTSTTSSAAGAGLAFGILALLIATAAVSLALFVLWVVMLVDALQRKNWQDDNQKNLWIILLVVSFFVSLWGIVAIVYYFAVRKQLGDASPAALHTPVEATVVSSPAKSTKSTNKPTKK
jgi:uncharacterized BrkB/YihY/UPF0761 family membrane protein